MPIAANTPPPKATVIISVYNNLHFLELVLAGLRIQTERAFEIIISDDGSGAEFVTGLQTALIDFPLPVSHNWQEDKGFLKNRILNSSIQKAAADYLIFLDGDCIPHPEFVAEHLKNAKLQTCLVGRRVDLSRSITEDLTAEKISSRYLQSGLLKLRMLRDYLQGRLGHLKSGFYIKNTLLRRFLNKTPRGILGANFSLHKADLLAINGFDERYNWPTFGEDTDVEFRLRLQGTAFLPLISIAVTYHCYHTALRRPDESRLLFESVVREARAFTPFGIKKDNPV